MKTHISLIILFMLISSVAFSQYQFSDQHNSTVLMPSFTGYEGTKFTTKYRDQYPSVPGSFTTIQATAEYKHVNYNSSFGIQYLRYSEMALYTNEFQLLYSYNIKLTDNFYIRPGAQFNVSYLSLHTEDLLWGDQIHTGFDPGYPRPTIQNIKFNRAIHFNFGASILTYGDNFWFALGTNHFLAPQLSFLDGTISRSPIEFIANGGYVFRSKKNPLSAMTLGLLYKNYGGFDQFTISGLWNNEFIVGGLAFRGMSISKAVKPFVNGEAIIATFGFKFVGLTIKYSYDFVISGLIGSTGGAHEITLSYNLKRASKE